MMNCAYNTTWLYNLSVVKESKRWLNHNIITDAQSATIRGTYLSSLYHPNFIIRILLFIATLLAIAGVTGLLTLTIIGADEKAIAIGAMFYGLFSFFVLENVFLKKSHHYKSGVTEAMLYHAMAFTLGGFIYLFNPDQAESNTHFVLFACLIVSVFAAIRYLDLLSTIAAIIALSSVLFYELYKTDGILRQIIPFAFIVVFTPIYFLAKRFKDKKNLWVWRNNFLMVEAISLLLIYIGGNYLVVRELSVEMMSLEIAEGEDIPFAMIFYILTVVIPASYLYFGIKNKDVVLIRVSLLLVAFSVFTFKYYFSLGHPEITLTMAGVIVLGITLFIMNYLKVIRNGFTRENVLSGKWADMNLEAFIVSQKLGGNQVNIPDQSGPGGGSFGGGGSSDSF